MAEPRGLALCPCGSGTAYAACCGPHHDGVPAPTAEALVRARYSAYATGRDDYVFATWHPRTRPEDLTPAPDLTWLGLDIGRVVDGSRDDTTGTVDFRARYRARTGEGVLHETSRFVRRAGRWVYLDGDVG